jgi:uncharacterized protein YkwD
MSPETPPRAAPWRRAPAAACAGILCTSLATGAPQPTGVRADVAAAERLVIEQTNAFRASAGAAPTTPNRMLTDAARYFAGYMARTDRYGHEADGAEPAQRAVARGYDYCMVSENIAYQYRSTGYDTQTLAAGFVDGWKHSPPHRRNMLERQATETGVAIAQSTRTGRYYAVQMFGRPKSMRVTFRIANKSPTALRYQLGDEWFPLPPRVSRTHEQCTHDALTLRLPGEPQATTIQPANGGRYEVEHSGGRYRLKG